MNRFFIIIFSIALLSNAAVAINTGPKKTAQTEVSVLMLTFVLIKTGIQLGDNGFRWLAAHFAFGEETPAAIALDQDEEVNAQLALSEVLENRAVHKAAMSRLLDRLVKQPPNQLLRIILNQRILEEVRFLARTVLRNHHILPMLADGRYDQLGRLSQAFRRLAGPEHNEARRIALYLFDFSHPDPQVELSQPSVHQFLRINQGARTLREALHEWTKNIHLTGRMKYVRDLVVLNDPALEQVQARIIALFHEVKDRAQNPDVELINTLHELHSSLLFFESLALDRSETSDLKPAKSSSNAIIQASLSKCGSARFPLTGDFEVDALLLGFEQDPDAISAAKENDSSDPKHRVSKGGGNSYIRGGLIISPDKDGHAGEALKMHIETGKGRWSYLDTVILVEIEGRLLFLCLGRNKELSPDYWSLVDPDGNWFRLQRSKPNAELEPATGPQKKEGRSVRSAPIKSQHLPFKRI